MLDFVRARTNMVDSQLRTSDVTDRRILAAMLEVPRERFVPEAMQAFAYMDEDLDLRRVGTGLPARHLMEPVAFAKLLQLAEIGSGDAVLDIGCATGYSTAVIARLAGHVVGLECERDLAEAAARNSADLGVVNAEIVHGPLESGHPRDTPYDIIVLEGSVEQVPQALFDQIKEGGCLVAVIGRGRSAQAVLHRRSEAGISRRPDFDCAVAPLPGFERPRSFVF